MTVLAEKPDLNIRRGLHLVVRAGLIEVAPLVNDKPIVDPVAHMVATGRPVSSMDNQHIKPGRPTPIVGSHGRRVGHSVRNVKGIHRGPATSPRSRAAKRGTPFSR